MEFGELFLRSFVSAKINEEFLLVCAGLIDDLLKVVTVLGEPHPWIVGEYLPALVLNVAVRMPSSDPSVAA